MFDIEGSFARATDPQSAHRENSGYQEDIGSIRTNVRRLVGLIRSGSGTVIGVCEVIDCIGPLTAHEFHKNARRADPEAR